MCRAQRWRRVALGVLGSGPARSRFVVTVACAEEMDERAGTKVVVFAGGMLHAVVGFVGWSVARASSGVVHALRAYARCTVCCARVRVSYHLCLLYFDYGALLSWGRFELTIHVGARERAVGKC